LLLTGCFGSRSWEKPTFKVGECFAREDEVHERWQTPRGYVHKVLEVGVRNYRALTVNPERTMVYETTENFVWDSGMEKVECPTQLGAWYE